MLQAGPAALHLVLRLERDFCIPDACRGARLSQAARGNRKARAQAEQRLPAPQRDRRCVHRGRHTLRRARRHRHHAEHHKANALAEAARADRDDEGGVAVLRAVELPHEVLHLARLLA
jgi:hypothetical protein